MESAVALAAAHDNNLLWDLEGLVIVTPVAIVILVIVGVATTMYLMSIVALFSIILGVMNLPQSLIAGIGIREMEGLYFVIDALAVVVMVQHLYYRNASVTFQGDTDSHDGDDYYISEDDENEWV